MDEPAAAHKTFARVFAVDHVVQRIEIGLAVALAGAGRGELPRIGLRVLHALGCRRMRGQEIQRARIGAVAGGAQRGVALHRGEEAHRAERIEAGARGDADADAVRLEFLRAREARQRQLRARQRQRRQFGIGADVGDDAADDRCLARLVLADRRMARDHMRHLVRKHRRNLRGVACQRDQAAGDVELAGRQREGVDRGRIQDRHLVGQIRPFGGGDELFDGLRDQPGEPRILIDAAIGGEDSLMLALGRGGLLHWRALRPRALRCGRRAVVS